MRSSLSLKSRLIFFSSFSSSQRRDLHMSSTHSVLQQSTHSRSHNPLCTHSKQLHNSRRSTVQTAAIGAMKCLQPFFYRFGIRAQIGHPFLTSTRRGEGSGSSGHMWTGEGGQAPCGRPHRKLQLEPTNVILSSSHAKKLASFFTGISSLDRKV